MEYDTLKGKKEQEKYMDEKNKQIEEILTRSVEAIYPTPEALKTLLLSEKKLRIYVGIDPTATWVHLGHATNYFILKRLHNLGHKITVLVGDFTAMIGDPSDKNATRPKLTKEEVWENLKTYKEQIGKILDFSDTKNPIEFRFNSEWLGKLSFPEVIELAGHFTVQQMTERDIFRRRLEEKKPLYMHEFFYPLMQGYDSVALSADLEIGGRDQTFNMLAGRTLVRSYQNREKFVLVTTLLEHPITKEKLMSKSLGTGIALNEKPNDMFGKIMAIADESIIQLFTDCTTLSLLEIKKAQKELENGTNPRDIKIKLAREIVSFFHTTEEADKAEEYFTTLFSKGGVPEDIKTFPVARGDLFSDIAIATDILSSKSEFKRKIDEKAVRFTEDRKGERIIEDYQEKINASGALRIGKKIIGLKVE